MTALYITSMLDRQRDTLSNWIDDHCRFSIEYEATLDDCFNSYVEYTTILKKEIPLSKKAFSKEFKLFLNPKVCEGKVNVTRRSHTIFKGLKVENGHNSDKTLPK